MRGMLHDGERRGEVFTGFCWGMLWDGDHLENPGVDKGIILKRIINK